MKRTDHTIKSSYEQQNGLSTACRKGLLLLFILNLFCMGALAENKLSIPMLDIGAGQEASVPIYLSNDSQVVAVQFRLILPQGFKMSDTTHLSLSDRKANHTVSIKKMGAYDYLVVLYSITNTPLRGNSGIVFRLPILVPDTCKTGNSFAFRFTEVILSARTGLNLEASSTPGGLFIVDAPRPDFSIENIQANSNELTPGKSAVFSWMVRNVGTKSTSAGWSEAVSLIAENGETAPLGTVYYNELLASGGAVSRQASFNLSQTIGLEGNVRVVVKITPYTGSGELPAAQINNAGTSVNAVNLKRLLQFTLTRHTMGENDPNPLLARIFRSGSRLTEQTFNIVSANPTRLSAPSTVNIPVNSSGNIFYLNAVDNALPSLDTTIRVTVSGNDYELANDSIVLTDNEIPALSITPSKTSLTEGDSLTLTISRQLVTGFPLDLLLSTDVSGRMTFPSELVIPANEKSVTVKIKTTDDAVPTLTAEPMFTVTAAKHTKAQCVIELLDNDIPAIQMALAPLSISESSGYQAVVGVVKRLGATTNVQYIKLSDNASGALYYSTNMITLEKGVSEKKFTVGVVDNDMVDGTRTFAVKASVYLSSCGCSATGSNGGVVQSDVSVLDDDGPSLKLTTSQTMLPEGKVDAAYLTLTRNTPTTEALVVTLSSDHPTELSISTPVTIPIGKSSIQVPVTAVKNDSTEGDRTVTIGATAAGFSKGICWVMITDQTLADATIGVSNVSAAEAIVKTTVDVTVQVFNEGIVKLPSYQSVDIYYSSDSLNLSVAATRLLNTFYTSKIISPGMSEQFSTTLTLPDLTGRYYLFAVVNRGQSTKELSYLNNTSKSKGIKFLAPFTATISADKATYKPGEKVLLNGVVTARGSSTISGIPVEVYILNNESRQTVTATTDANGLFELSYTPYAGQIGHFVIGACYPKEGLIEEQDAFDIFGLRRTTYANIIWDVLVGEDNTGVIELINPGNLAVTNLKTTISSDTTNYSLNFDPVSFVAGGAKIQLKYHLKAKTPNIGTDWEKIQFQVKSDEGATLDLTTYYYARTAKASLTSSIPSLQTTMCKGVVRNYTFTITNKGKGASGAITVLLPKLAWLSMVTPSTMPSLGTGESATITLQFAPGEELIVNVPITGIIGINCENGSGIPIHFRIETVSEQKGGLVVDVCDEYTYYTAEAPHLAGATVVVKHPYTQAVIAQGVTNDKGIFAVDSLQEGYYTLVVTAKQHDQYTNNILIDPGKTTKTLINLSFQAITYSWDVVETEVLDEYTLEAVVKFETNVPTPVVVTESPDEIDAGSIPVGQFIIYNITVTNKGLITAKDVNVTIPSGFNTLNFEALSETHFDLKPQSSVTIPVKVTKIAAFSGAPSRLRSATSANGLFDNCHATTITIYYWDCGLDRKWHEYGKNMKVYTCDVKVNTGPYTRPDWGPGIGVPSGPWTSGPINYTPNYQEPETVINDEGCEPCQNRFMYKMLKCFVTRIPIVSKILTFVETVQQVQRWVDGEFVWEDILVMAPEWVEKIIGYKEIYDDCLVPMFEDCVPGDFEGDPDYVDGEPTASPKLRSVTAMPDYIILYQEVLHKIYKMMNASENERYELFGDSAWMDLTWGEVKPFWEKLNLIEGKVELSAMAAFKPDSITDAQLLTFLDRWNNSRLNISSNNIIRKDYLLACYDSIAEVIDFAVGKGYSSVDEMFTKETELYQKEADLNKSSVCATITLKFSQTMTMTRQAFRGTLTVYNGHDTEPLKNVSLNLTIEDPEGNLVGSHYFQVNTESLDKLTGIDGNGTLSAKETGSAVILFIPTKYAAPIIPLNYSFGGTLSYLDPFKGTMVTRDLYPVNLTVRPSPDLELTYFMQRDVWGDDALTPNVVESMEPAEFTLLIHNEGAGDATKVKVSSKQPEIVDNEKGLLVDFDIISSALNGAESSIGVTDIDFGTIPAGTCTFGQWFFTSTLLGHFVEYDVTMTHVTSYDNPDLSLINGVTIHELIRSIQADTASTKRTGFLVNDVRDREDHPDILYLSDGSTREVNVVPDATFTKTSENVYTMTVAPTVQGWNFGSFEDPVLGKQKLLSVTKQGGGVLHPRNMWQTDRTLRDGREPIYEYRIHFSDEIRSASQTYVLTFEPRRFNVLAVVSYDSVPEKVSGVPINKVQVKFNRPIVDSTFTKEDLRLNCQGVQLNLDMVTTTPIDSVTYLIDLTSVTNRNGYFVLTVQTKTILDSEAFFGEYGKETAWNQYLSGKVELNLMIQPALSGVVTPDSSLYTYGSTVHFIAKPNPGYRFTGWMMDEQTLSTDSILTYTATEAKTIVCNFEPLYANLTLIMDATQGSVIGGNSGVYPYGSKLKLQAKPGLFYLFQRWIVNGTVHATTDTTTIEMKGKMMVQAVFVSSLYTVKHTLGQGWNWISTNFADASLKKPKQFLSPILNWTNKLLSFDKELVVDPIYGLTGGIAELTATESYKLKVNQACALTLSGTPYKASDVSIDLLKGWNWLGYPPSITQTPAVALSGVSPQINEVIKSQTDFSVYSGSDWVGTLDSMRAGEGYMYLANSSKTFAYQSTTPVLGAPSMTLRSTVALEDGWLCNIRQFADNMNLIIKLQSNGLAVNSADYTLAAFVGDECRGIGKTVGDLCFLTVYGQPSDELISFRILEKSTAKICSVKETVVFAENVVGSLVQPKKLNIGAEITGMEPDDKDFVLYPNPVRSRLYLSSRQPVVTGVRICRTDGRLLSLYDGDAYLTGVDVSMLPEGIYIIALSTTNGTYYQKFIKIGGN